MLATTAQIDGAANCRAGVSVPVPHLATATLGQGRLVMGASSEWFFHEAETSVVPRVSVYVGSPVSGVLFVEGEGNPKSVQLLTNLGNERYSLTEVLTVAIERDGDQFVAIEPRRGWYGYGNSEEQAIGQFAAAIVEELEVLSEREGELSTPMQGELASLRQVVIPRR